VSPQNEVQHEDDRRDEASEPTMNITVLELQPRTSLGNESRIAASTVTEKTPGR
jgi:hypothetical protein